ncbi:MAG: hypothetical protein H7Z15_00275 [Rhizobacter sp.]|nr:hypothetical protein [Rhizobacter sp.]
MQPLSPWRTLARLAIVVPVFITTPSGAAEEAGASFERLAPVLTHPRCMNCHTVTSFPRQGDERVNHNQTVMRGSEGKGVPALKCSGCHQDSNQGRVPGARNWHLAPLSMVGRV